MVADSKGDVYVDGDFDSYSVFGNDQLAEPIYTSDSTTLARLLWPNLT